MTSTNLVYSIGNLIKRMLWFPALACFAFLFGGTIASVIPLQQTLRAMALYPADYSQADIARELYTVVNNAFSYRNLPVGILLMLGAFAAGLIFFHYLHSRQQVDFYHSLPVKRSNLYLRHFIAGALAVVLPWLLNLLLTLLIICAMGQGGYISAANLFAGIGVHLLFFLVLYALAVLASLLAGNGVVAGILAALLWGFCPLALSMFYWLRSAMQPTWYLEPGLWERMLSYSSPVIRYINMDDSALALTRWDILLLLLLLAACVGLGLLVYRRRPSEAAGRALAFAQSRPIIKYPVTLLCMGFVGMMLHEIGDGFEGSFLWFMIGVVLGGFLAAQIMEIVYAFDFRAIRRRLLPLLIITLLFCGVSACGFLDTFGYNSYLPAAEEVVKVELYLDSTQDTGVGSLRRNYYAGSNSIGYSEAEKALVSLAGNNTILLPVSNEAGIRAAISIVDQQMQGVISDQPVDRNYLWQSVIRYYLADGSVKTRQYTESIPLYSIADELDAITAEQEYQQGRWPLFSADPACLRLDEVYAYEYGGSQQDDWNDSGYWLQQADISALVAAYAEELTAMDSAAQRASMPIGYLRFNRYADAAIAESSRDDTPQYMTYTYPVYPEFTRTLAALAELGFDQDNWLPHYAQAARAELYWDPEYLLPYAEKEIEDSAVRGGAAVAKPTAEYAEKYDASGTQVITREYSDPQQIRALIDVSFVQEAADMNPLVDINYASQLIVYYSDLYGNTETQYRMFRLDYTPPL